MGGNKMTIFSLFRVIYSDINDDGQEEKTEHFVVAKNAKEAVAKVTEKYDAGILAETSSWAVEKVNIGDYVILSVGDARLQGGKSE
jgi:hypothetical protein